MDFVGAFCNLAAAKAFFAKCSRDNNLSQTTAYGKKQDAAEIKQIYALLQNVNY